MDRTLRSKTPSSEFTLIRSHPKNLSRNMREEAGLLLFRGSSKAGLLLKNGNLKNYFRHMVLADSRLARATPAGSSGSPCMSSSSICLETETTVHYICSKVLLKIMNSLKICSNNIHHQSSLPKTTFSYLEMMICPRIDGFWWVRKDLARKCTKTLWLPPLGMQVLWDTSAGF